MGHRVGTIARRPGFRDGRTTIALGADRSVVGRDWGYARAGLGRWVAGRRVLTCRRGLAGPPLVVADRGRERLPRRWSLGPRRKIATMARYPNAIAPSWGQKWRRRHASVTTSWAARQAADAVSRRAHSSRAGMPPGSRYRIARPTTVQACRAMSRRSRRAGRPDPSIEPSVWGRRRCDEGPSVPFRSGPVGYGCVRTGRHQASPSRASQLIGASSGSGSNGVAGVSRTRMPPSSSGVGSTPRDVRTAEGPRQGCHPRRS